MDLAVPVLTEPVSQQSVAVVARYLFQQAGAGAATVYSGVCHHDPDRLHPGQLAAGGVAPQPHPVSTALHCAVTTPLTNDMFPLDLLQELLAPRPGHHGGIFNCVRLAAGGQQEAASTKLVSPAPSFSLCCCLCTK